MSLPTFPSFDPPLSTEESLNMILASIAMEELGLSHIINAEGEKLQYVLGTLNGCAGERASVQEVLAVNKSIKGLLDSVMQNQVILKSKMESALGVLEGSGGVTGPTGPPGPTGPTGPADPCRALSIPAAKQNWCAGRRLIWSRSKCSMCRPACLSPDGKSVLLGNCGCCAVSFSIDLCVLKDDADSVCIKVQTRERDKRVTWFSCHTPLTDDCNPVTVSAAGILISAHTCDHPLELMLTLHSPSEVKVNQASMCVIET